MISLGVDSKGVTLEYEPEFGGDAWVTRELDEKGEVTLGRVFTFERSDLISEKVDISTPPGGSGDRLDDAQRAPGRPTKAT